MATTKKITKDLIINVLEHCTMLDDDNYPNHDCTTCPMKEECKTYYARIPYEILAPILWLLKGEDLD